jgi:hypothetical protein
MQVLYTYKWSFVIARSPVKRFITTFVCLSTKAIHQKQLIVLTIEGFFTAAQRGIPQQMFSDNSTNIQGADNQLLDPGMLLQTKEQSEGVQVHPSNNLYEWKFTPRFGA